MLKVIIADDEAHICRLIQALVDWNTMGMEVIGVASNGVEAIEKVDMLKPDLLITDIRMPGCSGLELIEHVKTSNPNLEVIIISGFAHFPYAQTAMKFGVGDYLLKPINKAELIQTLQKIILKIHQRIESEQGLEQLLDKEQYTKQKLKTNLIHDLLENKVGILSINQLQNDYGMDIQEGVFQTFCLKLDYEEGVLSEHAIAILQEKIAGTIKARLQDLCFDYVFMMDAYRGYAVLHFDNKRQEDVRKAIRFCLNQFIIQKTILGPIDFTIAIHAKLQTPSGLADSLHQCNEIMKERIVLGTEQIIEAVPRERGLKGENLLEGYSRMIVHAVENLDLEESQKALLFLQDAVKGMKNIRGFEVLELVVSAGTLFLMQCEPNNQKEMIELYTKSCEHCNSVTMLFEQLDKIQTKVINNLKFEHDDAAIRPVRMAKKYIQHHYMEQITLEEVSASVGLSATYFSVLFKKEIGEGFAKYLMGVRIDAAKILLRESTSSVASICETVGYHDLKHFTHTFEKFTGLKPSAYRKLYG
ncbi:MAG: response regulator [Lachnospiraceae bacterium]